MNQCGHNPLRVTDLDTEKNRISERVPLLSRYGGGWVGAGTSR